MIEKLERHTRVEKGLTQDIKISCPPEQPEIVSKINELVDVINTIQKEREAERFEIQEWIGILEAVRKSVNVHERQIDKLQMMLEPHKCETRPENVQSGGESCPENVDPYAEQRKWIGCVCRFWYLLELKVKEKYAHHTTDHKRQSNPPNDSDNFYPRICCNLVVY